jgi:cytochrome c oxidase assembly factor CtaG/ferredoxin
VDPIAAAVLSSWSLDPWVALGLLLAAALYLRGFLQLHVQLPARYPRWRAAAFAAGIGALLLALASPLDAFADLLQQAHMMQHWLLMMVAPPLLWLGAPAVALLRGLPQAWLRRGLGPFLAWPGLRRALRRITRPGFAWPAWALTLLLWHWPPLYQAALRSSFWHDVEHVQFFTASLLFWYPVVAPWPERAVRGERMGLVLYLGLAAVFNSVFSAVFTFSSQVFYPLYLEAPRPWGIAALADQNAAGAFLWVAASLPMLAAAVAVLISELEPATLGRVEAAHTRGLRPRPLRLRRAGALLRSLALRRVLQCAMLALALVVVVDGLLGPQRPSATNLAGTLPWLFWRGLVVIGLLLFGNVFCAVCPFTLSRSVAARWLGRPLRWPAALRGKWLAAGLFVLYLWAYEAFALWDSPWWTAWIVVGYFAASFLVEGLFPRGSFCRYVCPIGQFHFIGAGVSPVEVRALDVRSCARCSTRDCLRGNDASPGCPTGLLLPTKTSSLDCTFCLDCVRACPHQNAGVVPVVPGSTLGASRFGRLDVAALALVFCFGAFANAAAMVAPVAAWERAMAGWLGAGSTLPVTTLWLAAALLLTPLVLSFLCTVVARSLGGVEASLRGLATRLAPALVPVGFAMWLSHFGFHLLAGLGIAPAALTGLEIAALGAGLVVSVAVAWRLALEVAPRPRQALGVAAPWALLATALYGIGTWIVLQPMEMRGMAMS